MRKKIIDTTPENLYRLMNSSDVQEFVQLLQTSLDKLNSIVDCPDSELLARKNAIKIWKSLLGTINTIISSKE